MALALARTLVRRKTYDKDAALAACVRWYESHPFDCGIAIGDSLRARLLNPRNQATYPSGANIMTDDDRAWLEELRRTKTEGHIGARRMRRLLAILDEAVADADRLDREAGFLASLLAASNAPCPSDNLCTGKVRLECMGLDDEAKCRMCYRKEARRAGEKLLHEQQTGHSPLAGGDHA